MKPYHPENLKRQPFPHWRVIVLAWVGKILGVQFHVAHMPFGGSQPAFKRPPLGPKPNFSGDWMS